jgi:hypothetical protein
LGAAHVWQSHVDQRKRRGAAGTDGKRVRSIGRLVDIYREIYQLERDYFADQHVILDHQHTHLRVTVARTA